MQTPIASQWDKQAMESVVPQASCLHRKHDKGRRDACGTDTTAFATEYHQWPSVPRYNMFGDMGIGHKGTDREGIRPSTPATR